MDQTEIDIFIQKDAAGEYWVNYKSECRGPYRDICECYRAIDLLTIKLALECGVERSTDMDLTQSVIFIQEEGARLNEIVRGQEASLLFIQEQGARLNEIIRGQSTQQSQQLEAAPKPLPRARAPNLSKPAHSSPLKKIFEELNGMKCIPRPPIASARKDAFPGSMSPVLRPRISSPFWGVGTDQHGYYAEIEIPSIILAPQFLDSSEHSLTCIERPDSAFEPLEQLITVPSISCKTEEEAALAHDLLVLWQSRGEGNGSPHPNSLNFPLTKLWEQAALVQEVEACETPAESKACIDRLIESGKLRNLLMPVPIGSVVGAANPAAAADKLSPDLWSNDPTRATAQQHTIHAEVEQIDNKAEKGEAEYEEVEEEYDIGVEPDEEAEGKGLVGQKRRRQEFKVETDVEDNAPRRLRGHPQRLQRLYAQGVWTNKEMDILETELISELGKSWWNKICIGHGIRKVDTRIYGKIADVFKSRGYDCSVDAVAGKTRWLKILKMQGSQEALRGITAPAAAAANAIEAVSASFKPHVWQKEETELLERELISELGENWWDVIGKGQSHFYLYNEISEKIWIKLRYNRSSGAVGAKANKLRFDRQEEARITDLPQFKSQKQQLQRQERRQQGY